MCTTSRWRHVLILGRSRPGAIVPRTAPAPERTGQGSFRSFRASCKPVVASCLELTAGCGPARPPTVDEPLLGALLGFSLVVKSSLNIGVAGLKICRQAVP